jgi:hypothetical protein
LPRQNFFVVDVGTANARNAEAHRIDKPVLRYAAAGNSPALQVWSLYVERLLLDGLLAEGLRISGHCGRLWRDSDGHDGCAVRNR